MARRTYGSCHMHIIDFNIMCLTTAVESLLFPAYEKVLDYMPEYIFQKGLVL